MEDLTNVAGANPEKVNENVELTENQNAEQTESLSSAENNLPEEVIADQEPVVSEVIEDNSTNQTIHVEETVEEQTPVVSEVIEDHSTEEAIAVEETVVEETPVVSEIIEESNQQEKVEATSLERMEEEAPLMDSSVEKSLEEISNEHIEDTENLNIPTEEEEFEEKPAENFAELSRQQMVDVIEDIVKENIEKVKQNVALLKISFYSKTNQLKKEAYEKFLAEGGIKEDYNYVADVLEDRFKKALNTYRDKRTKYLEGLERAKQENLTNKTKILDELKELIASEETLKKTYDDFKALQERWKEIGAVPREEVNNLWKNYHFLIEKFFDKVKINKELKMLDLRKNLEQKILLCEKVEELLLEESISESFKKLQAYREQWREIGPVPTEKNEEIWVRFCTAAEQIDSHRKEYYDKISAELQQNLLAKTALCENAEGLIEQQPKTVKEWNDMTDQMDELMKMWKSIGTVPRASNNEIWSRFKNTLDAFFTAKKEFLDKIKDEQNICYNKKVDICIQAEEIAKRNDWKRATEELLKLQKEWKEVGAVPRKVSEKIWKRFRSACDEFFASKAAYFSDIKSSEADNLAKKEGILARLKEYQFTEDKNENLNVIKNFQREWMEVGFVPMEHKDRLQTEFRSYINGLFEKLKISIQESEKRNYKSKIDNFVGKSNHFISKEKSEVMDKIQKLRSNLTLWENNIGFLAQSKQADILKKEFAQKMEKARNEIALLEMKLKMLAQTKEEPKGEKVETVKTEKVETTELKTEKPLEAEISEEVKVETVEAAKTA